MLGELYSPKKIGFALLSEEFDSYVDAVTRSIGMQRRVCKTRPPLQKSEERRGGVPICKNMGPGTSLVGFN